MNIIFVCMGNTCRSPMAAGYLASKGIPWIEVKSKGLFADGAPVCETAVKAMAEVGIDISSHISSSLTKEDVLWTEKIICMSKSHMAQLLAAGISDKKLSVLSGGINDPFGGDIEVYRACRDEIFRGIDMLFEQGFFSEFSISPISQRHIAGLAKLEEVCFSQPWSADALLESFKRGTKFFVAENADHIMGYIGFNVVLDEGYITNVAVFPKYRRMGVATALVRKAISYSKKNGLAFLSLEVRKSNSAAIALYENEGFKTEGERKNFYTNPKENALIMTVRF